MRRFEFVDGSSNKFWEIDYSPGSDSFTVTYGRIGTDGVSQTKTFDSAAKAELESQKLINEKVKKGYVEFGVLRADERSTDRPFAGRSVGDFPAATPGPGVAVRIHVPYDGEAKIAQLVADLAAHPDAASLEALVLGGTGDSMDDPNLFIDPLLTHAHAFPHLKALFYGDASQETSEVSWIYQGDQAKLANAFPELEVLHIRGAGDGTLDSLSLPHLHTLILETGGLLPKTVQTVLAMSLPSLQHLELWLGDDSYGGETTVADLEPLLAGRVHTGLKYLGLRNSMIADELAFALSQSPILGWIEELDLSLGTIGDEGFIALSQMGPTPKLRSLDVSHHYAGAGAMKALRAAMAERNVKIDTTDHQSGEDDERWVTLSE
jgi:predicted DNA-binding WGR domain protein